MSRKDNKETENDSEVLEVSEIIEPSDEFDLSVLKSDINNAEKKLKDSINQRLIDQANEQKDDENFQEKNEKIQSFDEVVVEFLEFLFSFVNRKLDKMDVSKFDNKFANDLVEKLMPVISKDQMNKLLEYVGAGNKFDSSKRLFRISKLLMFISQEIFSRYDEYNAYREAHGKSKLFVKEKEA